MLMTVLLLVSCKTSNDVVTGRKFQKRKYTSGWYVDRKTSHKNLNPSKERIVQENPSLNSSPSASVGSLQPNSTPEVHTTAKSGNVSEKPQSEKIPAQRNQKFENYERSHGASAATFSATTNYESFGLKKKKRKEKLEPLTLWGVNSIALSTWLLNWPIHLPVVGIPLIILGMILLIASLTKLKKTKKRNKFYCYLGLISGILLIVITLAL
jgi:hypothetical protein